MKGSLQVAKMFGIPIKVHWTFSLFILYIAYVGYSQNYDGAGILGIIGCVLGLFACVVLHEYGHALTARRYGVSTRDIIISPIGGVARLERLPEKPIQEFYVAIAGPMVNVVIALLVTPIVLWLFWSELRWDSWFLYSFVKLAQDFNNPLTVFPFLIMGNVILVGFNLLPAFPMDGGRVFRSLLSMKVGRLRATQIASYFGNVFGVGMIALGVYLGSFVYPFIGLFVFLMATQEYRMVKMESILRENLVKDIMRKDFTRIAWDDNMSAPISYVQRGLEKNFLVFDMSNQLIGVLHEAFVHEAIKKRDWEGPVAEYLSQAYVPLEETDNMEKALKLMQGDSFSILPVIKEGEVVGVVDVTTMNRFLQNNKKPARTNRN